jgi:hypothetical protein
VGALRLLERAFDPAFPDDLFDSSFWIVAGS